MLTTSHEAYEYLFSWVLVANLHWDDSVELCGERRKLHRADSDFHPVMHLPLQYLHVARYAHSHNQALLN